VGHSVSAVPPRQRPLVVAKLHPHRQQLAEAVASYQRWLRRFAC
jgi:hypothetical protein